MDLFFKNKRITGMLTIVPQKSVSFEDEMSNFSFSPAKSKKLALVMGYKNHRIAAEGQTSSDFCLFGLNYLIDNGLLNKDDIDALVMVTQTPDFQMPPTSNVLHGKLGLKDDVICMDINQGCAGFELGLIQACLLLEQPAIRKVVFLNADVMSPKVSKFDRNSWSLIADAASITIIEKCEEESPIYCNIKMDGKGWDVLMIPAGGARTPHSEQTAELIEDEAGNKRALDNLVMKGDEVFNFVQRVVPPMINHLMEVAGAEKENVDWFMFHQPNKFMLNKVADAIGVPYEKMPANIVENFGNASGVTVPTAICFNLGEKLEHESYKVCVAGFGVGLTWSSALLTIGNLDFCKLICF